jgi:hypothetical protein
VPLQVHARYSRIEITALRRALHIRLGCIRQAGFICLTGDTLRLWSQ